MTPEERTKSLMESYVSSEGILDAMYSAYDLIAEEIRAAILEEREAAQKRIEDLERQKDDALNCVEMLFQSIRKHRDQRGDDRCYLDDHELYLVLPEGDTRPTREIAVTLENCAKFIECRQQGREYVSPQRRIEELEAALQAILSRLHTIEAEEKPWGGGPFSVCGIRLGEATDEALLAARAALEGKEKV